MQKTALEGSALTNQSVTNAESRHYQEIREQPNHDYIRKIDKQKLST